MGGLIILPLMMFAGLPFIPESPLWFVLKGRPEDAKSALQKINKDKPEYDPAEDIETFEETRRVEEQHAEESSWKSLLSDPIERRKLFYSCGAMVCSQVCGILFFYVYGVVFAQAIGIKDPFLIQLITNILQIFAVAASVITGNKVPRRMNLFITNSMMLFAFIVIGGIGTQGANPTTASQYVIVVFSYIVIMGKSSPQSTLIDYSANMHKVTTSESVPWPTQSLVRWLSARIRTRSCPPPSSSSTLSPGHSPSPPLTCTMTPALVP